MGARTRRISTRGTLLVMLGAALLAGVGAGVWRSVEAACETAVQVAKRVEPIARNVQLMNRRYEEHRKLYPALRGIAYRN